MRGIAVVDTGIGGDDGFGCGLLLVGDGSVLVLEDPWGGLLRPVAFDFFFADFLP